MDLAAKTTATLTDKDGLPAGAIPARFLTNEEQDLLKRYQAWGAREGLQGSMTCNSCGEAVEVHVQADIGFFCRCRVLVWKMS